MTKTRPDLAILQEEARELFYKKSTLTENERQHLFFIWNQFPKEILTEFVHKNEAIILAKLAGSEEILLEGSLRPWSKKDMDAYYILHPTYDEATCIDLYERRKILANGFPLTIHDELQLSRVQHIEPQSKLCFKQLELLANAHAIINPIKSPEQYYFNYLFALLATYRTQLKSACKTQKAADPANYASATLPVKLGMTAIGKDADYSLQYSPDITEKVDWITRYIAAYLNRMIETQQTDKYVNELKEIVKQLGELKDEVFPWLSVMVRRQLFKLTCNHGDVHAYIDGFINFHALLEPIAPYQLTKMGISFASYVRQNLQAEIAIGKGIFSSDFDKKLINIKHYLTQSRVSPWMMLQICEDLMPVAKTSLGSRPDVALLMYLLLERIKRDKLVLPQACQYVSNLTHDEYCPALPPAAPLFYAMLQRDPARTKAMMIEYAEKYPAVLHETLLLIFSDDKYIDQHEQLLDLNIHPRIHQVHYPLFALKRAYEKEKKPDSDKSLLMLWIQLIDSGMLTEIDFFAKEANQKLFAKLEPLCEDVLHSPFLSPHGAKMLANALAWYRATQLNFQFYKPCVIRLPMFGPTGVSYNAKSDWAEKSLSDLLKQVAYPGGSVRMDFDNILRFLDIEFDYASRAAKSTDELQEQISKESNEFFASNRQINTELFHKFIHVFYQLYQKNQSSDVANIPVYVDTLMRDLPSLYLSLLDIMFKPEYVALPTWFSPSLQVNIQGAMTQLQVYEDSMQQLKVFNKAWKNSSHYSLETDDTLPAYANMLRFLKHLYIAYCKQSIEVHRVGDWDAFLKNQACKDKLQSDVESIHALLKTMKNALEDHHEKTLHPPGLLNIGYNREESQAQLDHFKKLYNDMVKNDFRELATCRKILEQVTDATSSNTFKRSFWLGSFYHDYLIRLQDALTHLEQKIMHSNKESKKRFYIQDEKKVSVVGSGCSLYATKEQSKPLLSHDRKVSEQKCLPKLH